MASSSRERNPNDPPPELPDRDGGGGDGGESSSVMVTVALEPAPKTTPFDGLERVTVKLSSLSFALSFVMLLLTGALDNISVVVRATLVQVLTPDAMRGRVSAVNAVFIGSSNELGGFESGVTAQLFGPVASVVGGGIGTILVVLVVALAWPGIRRLGSLHEVARRQALEPAEA